jgi:hypothetical protein
MLFTENMLASYFIKLVEKKKEMAYLLSLWIVLISELTELLIWNKENVISTLEQNICFIYRMYTHVSYSSLRLIHIHRFQNYLLSCWVFISITL